MRLAFDDLIIADPSSLCDEAIDRIARELSCRRKSSRKRAYQRLLLAYRDALETNLTDHLTGLLNREGLMKRLQSKIEGLRAQGGRGDRRYNKEQNSATVFIDLDGFKAVNDHCGHEVGDNALKEVASRLKSAFRVKDVVARIGGDELALVIEPYDPDEHFNEQVIAERIHKALEGLVFWADKKPYPICASLGIVIFNEQTIRKYDGQNAADVAKAILKNADERMYIDKSSGKQVRLKKAEEQAVLKAGRAA